MRARGGEDHEEGQRRAGRSRGTGVMPGGPGRERQMVEERGEQAQAERKRRGIRRAARHRRRFVEARPARRRRLGKKGPRYHFGPAEDRKDEEADGEGSAGGALGEQRECDEQRGDLQQHPFVSLVHARALQKARDESRASFLGGGRNRGRNHIRC